MNPEGGAPDEARQAGVGVEEPAREADGQAHHIATHLQQVAEAVVLHRLYNMAIRGGKGRGVPTWSQSRKYESSPFVTPTGVRPSRYASLHHSRPSWNSESRSGSSQR